MAAGLVIPRGSAFTGIADHLIYRDSNVTGAQGDLVNIQSAQIEIVDAGEAIRGVLQEAVTSASTDAAIVATPWLLVVMDNDNTGTTFAATHVDALFDITGGTGAQIVDTSSVDTSVDNTQVGQLLCTEYNPQGIRSDLDSDTSVGMFMLAEQQGLHFV